MITIRDIDKDNVTGYLGNKLFILAAAYDLAMRNIDDFVIPHFEFENLFKEKFFKISEQEIITTNEYNEPFFHYKEIPYSNSLNLNGYFQSPKYFQNTNVKELFRPASELKNKILKMYGDSFTSSNVCSIHVRRGDYLNLSQHHPVLEESYYKKAIDMFPDSKFIICSNDIHWCKEHFEGSRFIFSETKQEKSQGNSSAAFDLYLMSMCNNNIIANSSMSWWSAYLNDSKNKKVICPKNWFGPALSCHDTKDLYPQNWIKI